MAPISRISSARHVGLVGDQIDGGVQDLGQAIDPVHQHLPFPRQVVQADVLELHLFGRHVVVRRESPLESDRDVAEPERPVAFVQQRLRHQAGRVGEIDEPGAGSAASSGLLRQLQDDGYRSERLREPAGTGRLLTDAPEPQGDRLVLEPRCLPAHPQLHDDELCALERFVALGREREASRPSGPCASSARRARPRSTAARDRCPTAPDRRRATGLRGSRTPRPAPAYTCFRRRRPPPSHPCRGHRTLRTMKSLGNFPDPFSPRSRATARRPAPRRISVPRRARPRFSRSSDGGPDERSSSRGWGAPTTPATQRSPSLPGRRPRGDGGFGRAPALPNRLAGPTSLLSRSANRARARRWSEWTVLAAPPPTGIVAVTNGERQRPCHTGRSGLRHGRWPRDGAVDHDVRRALGGGGCDRSRPARWAPSMPSITGSEPRLAAVAIETYARRARACRELTDLDR